MNDITINSISLGLEEDWELRETSESLKTWFNKSGDKVSLDFFSNY